MARLARQACWRSTRNEDGTCSWMGLWLMIVSMAGDLVLWCSGSRKNWVEGSVAAHWVVDSGEDSAAAGLAAEGPEAETAVKRERQDGFSLMRRRLRACGAFSRPSLADFRRLRRCSCQTSALSRVCKTGRYG